MTFPLRLSAAILAAAALALAAGGAQLVAPGRLAPRFSLNRLDDDSRRMALREYADSARRAADPAFGKPVVLAFWGTTCVSCKAELPRLQKWAAARPGVKLVPVLVENVPADSGRRILSAMGLRDLGVLDRYQVAGRNYGVCDGNLCTVPALVAVGADQVVRLAKSGYRPEEPLEASLDRALGVAGR